MKNVISLQQKKVYYERKMHNMGKSGKKVNNDNDSKEEVSPTKRFYEHPVFLAVVPTVVVGLISISFNIYNSTSLNKNDINHLNERIDNVEKLINDVKEDLHKEIDILQKDISIVSQDLKDHEKESNSRFDELYKDIGKLQGVTGVAKIDEDGDFAKLVMNTYQSDQSVYLSSGIPLWNNNKSEIAKNAYSNIVYTADELENTTIVLHYKQNGEDVFFKGQYDENGYWNDNCIINRYLDGKLTLIMDAKYVSGKLISYKQVFSYKKTYHESTYDVWAISEREPENGTDRGFTKTYYKEGEYDQQFTSNLVMDTDILNAEEFMSKIILSQEGYYNGYISNGLYNDDTGDAYTIKYSRDGFIRFLYVGNFEDGDLTDDTGNAWYIVLGDDKINYYYYKGKFKEAECLDDTDDPWLPLSPEEIESITSGKNWGCDLNWKTIT